LKTKLGIEEFYKQYIKLISENYPGRIWPFAKAVKYYIKWKINPKKIKKFIDLLPK
jgi:hypothetical protein